MSETLNKAVVFVDLSSSTSLFERLGDLAATALVRKITTDIAVHLKTFNGRILKFLGDGVMAIFDLPGDAVYACIQLHVVLNYSLVEKSHFFPRSNIALRVGIDYGHLVEIGNDAYGDTVNVASRVMSMAKPDEIMLTAEVYKNLSEPLQQNCRRLGRMLLRGKEMPQLIYGLDLVSEDSNVLTQFNESGFTSFRSSGKEDEHDSWKIKLRYKENDYFFVQADMPIIIGRSPECNLVIDDSRVSRTHVSIDYIDSQFYVSDISINGTMVQYGDAQEGVASYPVTMRRQKCILLRYGQIILGIWNPAHLDLQMPPSIFYQILDVHAQIDDGLKVQLTDD